MLIASAVFGVIRPGERICAYKADMGTKVPRMRESLAAFWRKPLAKALPAGEFVLDLRSGSYAAAWRPGRSLGVRGFTEAPDGSRKVITHMAKRVRGDVARLVLRPAARARRRRWPRSPRLAACASSSRPARSTSSSPADGQQAEPPSAARTAISGAHAGCRPRCSRPGSRGPS